MSDFSKDQQWKLTTNAEYQKSVAIIMNLAAASLVIPLVLTKEFGGVPDCKPVPQHLHWTVLVGWILLGLALVSGCVFHYASGKFVKAVCEGYGVNSTAQ